MSKKVSLDEKRARMLQLFYEKREFFTLKELEKIAPKEKNIVVQSVKDVLQALVDDGFVRTDKIGSTIFFWTFPGENITTMEQRIADTNKNIVAAEFKLKTIDEEFKQLESVRKDSEKIKALIAETDELKKQEIELKSEIEKYADSDPAVIAEIAKNTEEYKSVANIWTDNIFAIQSWCKNKFDISPETLNKHFRIPGDMDYLE